MEDPVPPQDSPTLLPVPFVDIRWVHAGAQHLDLLDRPITAISTTYKAFSEDESARIETAWRDLSDTQRSTAIREWGQGEGEGAKKKAEPTPDVHPVDAKVKEDEVVRSGQEQTNDPDCRYKDLLNKLHKTENLEKLQGVPVSQDSLFEVDLASLSLHPVFWAHTGPRVSVLRGTWFVGDETKPCSWDLAQELDKAYLEIRPWQPSYKHELATAVSQGAAAEEKLKYALPARFGSGLGIIFEDGEKGRLETSGALTYLSKTIWASLRTKPSGTYVYRGYAAACAASGTSGKDSQSSSRRGSSNSVRPKKIDAVVEAARTLDTSALEEENAPIVSDDVTPCTDLVLVIHGIGQQLATQYEAYNFVYAGNQLRQVMRKQSADPALSSIARNRRIQVLPVQWRASLQLDEAKTEEDRHHSMDNRFTIADITLQRGVPWIRELTNSVLLDIPLFMSQHRQKMIEAVCMQANRLYRLWLARNPDFEKNGRVHIIGHSLGSALVAHILSNQPTRMPAFSQLPLPVITQTRDRFLFNTSNLFLCGSPLGIFLHLDQAQIMPRKGRERTMNSPQDEALDRAGKFGCMAVDSLYNIFFYTDPVAYQLNAAVDRQLAATRKPLAITSVTSSITSSLSKYLPTSLRKQIEGKPQRPGAIRLPSGLEMRGPDGHERLEGSRGERRFSALNAHGSIDFYLQAAGPSEYLDMITSHASYWTDPSFAAFLIAETFSTRLDLLRTGLGLAEKDTA